MRDAPGAKTRSQTAISSKDEIATYLKLRSRPLPPERTVYAQNKVVYGCRGEEVLAAANESNSEAATMMIRFEARTDFARRDFFDIGDTNSDP